MWRDGETVSPGQTRCETVKRQGSRGGQSLDISGQCPRVIHALLLQSPAAGTREIGGEEGECLGCGGQPPYPGERPFASLKLPSVACSSDKMKVIWDYSTCFTCIIRNDTIQMLHVTVV